MSAPAPTGCVLCGAAGFVALADETRVVQPRPPGQVVRCAGCALVRVEPQPTAEQLAEFYAGDSLAHAQEACWGQVYVSGDREPAPHLARRLQAVEKRLGGPGRLLDVGAARGVFLNYARSRGWEIRGVELSEGGVRFAREEFGIELEQKTLSEARLETGSVDVVNISHVLEHFRDPLAELVEARRLLRAGGLLVIEVPNEFGDLFAEVRRLLLREPRPAYAVPSPHLYFFTPATLAELVRKAGFEPVHRTTPNREARASRYPGGALLKRVVFATEVALGRGPLIELFALRG